MVDALILIAVLAVGLALAKSPYLKTNWEMAIVLGVCPTPSLNRVLYHASLIFPCIAPLTFALPCLELRESWRAPRRRMLKLGSGSCVAASAALLLQGLDNLYGFLVGSWQIGPLQPWIFCGEKVGFGVIGAWAMLAAYGRCRVGSGWVDRIAFLVGLCWAFGAVAFVVLKTRWMEIFRALHWIS